MILTNHLFLGLFSPVPGCGCALHKPCLILRFALDRQSFLVPPQTDHGSTTGPLLAWTKSFLHKPFQILISRWDSSQHKSFMTAITGLLYTCPDSFSLPFSSNISFLNSQISLQLHYLLISSIMTVHCRSLCHFPLISRIFTIAILTTKHFC